MAAMKDFILDVCYMHRDGFTNEEIAEKYGVTVDYVEEAIELYYQSVVL